MNPFEEQNEWEKKKRKRKGIKKGRESINQSFSSTAVFLSTTATSSNNVIIVNEDGSKSIKKSNSKLSFH